MGLPGLMYKYILFHSDGGKQYFDGNKCRIEYPDGTIIWTEDNKIHRLDGPAVLYYDGFGMWYYNDKRIEVKCQEEFQRKIKLLAFL